MPHRHRYIPEERVCFVRYEGEMTVEEIREADARVFAEARGMNLRFVFDLRAVRVVGGAVAVRDYARWLESLDLERSHPGLRQALIADRPHETGLSLLLATIARGAHGLQVFSTPEAACRSLDIRPELVAEHADLIPTQG